MSPAAIIILSIIFALVLLFFMEPDFRSFIIGLIAVPILKSRGKVAEREWEAKGYSGDEGVDRLIKEGQLDDAKELLKALHPIESDTFFTYVLLYRCRSVWVERARERLKAIVESHISTLARKRQQLIYKDDYGVLHTEDWVREIEHFTDHVLKPEGILQIEIKKVLGFDWRYYSDYNEEKFQEDIESLDMSDYIDQMVECFDDPAAKPVSIGELSPIDFERKCAEEMEIHGLSAHVTKSSGDQGADVVAEYKGYRLVCQCKKYESPVGNKAVQEVYSAKSYYKGALAVVISTAGYTKAARQLADSVGVKLLAFEQIGDLALKFIEKVDSMPEFEGPTRI